MVIRFDQVIAYILTLNNYCLVGFRFKAHLIFFYSFWNIFYKKRFLATTLYKLLCSLYNNILYVHKVAVDSVYVSRRPALCLLA